MRNNDDNEIDFFELIGNLWKFKLLIGSFIFIAIAIGLIFNFNQKSNFRANIIYSIETLPPGIPEEKILSRFQKTFYSESVFKNWEKDQKNTSILFNTISNTRVEDGFFVRRSDSEKLAQFKEKITSDYPGKITYVQINSKNKRTINEFYKYFQHVNNLLTLEYVLMAKEDRKILRSRISSVEKGSSSDPGTLSEEKLETNTFISDTEKGANILFVNLGSLSTNLLKLNRYISGSDKGANLLFVNYPTSPISNSITINQILVIAILIGGFFGIFFALLYISILKNRKKRVSK